MIKNPIKLQRMSNNRSGDAVDVFVFQMGKVASTSITQAITSQGLSAIQTHWLGQEQILGSLNETLLNVDLDEQTAFRGLDQFINNIRNTRTLLWYKKHHQRDGKKLKVITLTRDPLNWYWGHIAQNFDLYGRLMLDWYRQTRLDSDNKRAAGTGEIEEAAVAFHAELFETMGRMSNHIDDQRFQAEAGRQTQGAPCRFLSHQLMKLRLPTAWFDVTFKPNLDINVYDTQLDTVTGTARYENDYVDVLLIRYEDIDKAIEPMRAFLDTPELTLERKNVTSKKKLDIDIKALKKQAPPTQAALRKLYESRYCRHFGYATPYEAQ